jgi:succinoglycan biosynthesis protein ExoA
VMAGYIDGSMGQLRVSVVIPARDEREALPALIRSIEAQSLAPDEVIVADGMSQDGTREWLVEACAERPWLRMVDNPARTISPALNTAIAAAQGPLVARMDAHAVYAEDYLQQLVQVFESDETVVAAGGMMRTEGRGPWGAAIATVLRRRFGLGGAGHRVGGASGPVDHTFSPMYRKQAVIDVGGFDESMLANEDFELDHRLRQAGGTVWLEASATCTWFTRDSLPDTARQMRRYGSFKARTLWLWPRSLRMRQLAPPSLILGLVLAPIHSRRLGGGLWTAYLGTCGILAVRAARADGSSAIRAAAVVPVVHLSWGAGLLAGIWTHRRPRRRHPDGQYAAEP